MPKYSIIARWLKGRRKDTLKFHQVGCTEHSGSDFKHCSDNSLTKTLNGSSQPEPSWKARAMTSSTHFAVFFAHLRVSNSFLSYFSFTHEVKEEREAG